MSKHQKEVRRERMKAERGRSRQSLFDPKSAIRNPQSVPAALAAAAAIAGGTVVYASPVRYENDASFEWNPSAGHEVFDVTADSFSQPGTLLEPGTFRMQETIYGWVILNGSGLSLNKIQVEWPGGYAEVVGVDSGALIPTTSDPDIGFCDGGYIYENSGYPTVPTLLPAGEDTYLGVRFDPGDGFHYGWIGVVRDPDGVNPNELDLFAWGYETEPGVAIPAGAVPEPGTLALLALGAVAVAGRRQRGNQATSENRLRLTAP